MKSWLCRTLLPVVQNVLATRGVRHFGPFDTIHWAWTSEIKQDCLMWHFCFTVYKPIADASCSCRFVLYPLKTEAWIGTGWLYWKEQHASDNWKHGAWCGLPLDNFALSDGPLLPSCGVNWYSNMKYYRENWLDIFLPHVYFESLLNIFFCLVARCFILLKEATSINTLFLLFSFNKLKGDYTYF